MSYIWLHDVACARMRTHVAGEIYRLIPQSRCKTQGKAIDAARFGQRFTTQPRGTRQETHCIQWLGGALGLVRVLVDFVMSGCLVGLVDLVGLVWLGGLI